MLMGKRTTLLLDIEPVENCAECTFVEPVKKNRSYVKCTNLKVDKLSFSFKIYLFHTHKTYLFVKFLRFENIHERSDIDL